MFAAMSDTSWVPKRPLPTPSTPWFLSYLTDETQKPIGGYTYKFVRQTQLQNVLEKSKSFLSGVLSIESGIFLLLGYSIRGHQQHCYVFNAWKRLIYLCDDDGTCVEISDDDRVDDAHARVFTSQVMGMARGFRRVYLLMKK
jgi:hypothetical protein